MIVVYQNGALRVLKEPGDRRYGKDESLFWYHLRCKLLEMGYDVVKRRMYKDGHMVLDSLFYVRDRKHRWCLYDNLSAVRFMSQDFDTKGEVSLSIQGEMLP